MPKDKKNRLVYVLKYMWEHTDEDNQTTLNQIVQHLMTLGIEATPRTLDMIWINLSSLDSILFVLEVRKIDIF